MPELDIQSDAFLQLLTDALRAGPGSPEWRQAVGQIRSSNGKGNDEYQLLLDAREHLESGKAYRTVAAGAGFTRKLMAGLEDETDDSKGKSVPTANLVAVGSALVLLLVIGFVAYLLFRGSEGAPPADDLRSIYFGSNVLGVTFDQGGIPSGWQAIGTPPDTSTKSLRPPAANPSNTSEKSEYRGSGIIATTALPSDQPVAIEVSLDVAAITEDVITQIFVTENPNFTNEQATSQRELVWLLKGDQVQAVLPIGTVEASDERITAPRSSLMVRIVIGKEQAILESGGEAFWLGMHGLDPKKPRFVGIRFLTRGGGADSASNPIAVKSLRILKPQAGKN